LLQREGAKMVLKKKSLNGLPFCIYGESYTYDDGCPGWIGVLIAGHLWEMAGIQPPFLKK